MSRYLFISVKEEFTEKILQGTKSIELRKVRPNVLSGDHVIIYCTSPVKAIVGVAKLEQIISHKPNEMWKLHSSKLGIDKKGFDEYYNKSEKAVGLVLTNARRLNQKIELKTIRKVHPKFSPPQTYRYFEKFVQASIGKSFTLAG
jgi:predicted transcriptional regulator